ncbi:TPA: phage tail protein [Escherichia coli]|nr:phage tail protein [Escherichia coli]
MSALLTKAFEKWVAECTASNLPARPDAIIFALMEREPTREDNTVPEDRITYAVNELTCGQLSQDTIVCSAVVPDDCVFSYDWICLIHQASGTLCGVIKTPVRQKTTGESLVRNFTITYRGIAQSAQISVPPQSWQVDITPELKTALKTPNHLSEIAAEGEEAQQESRDNLGLKVSAIMEPQGDIRDRTEGCLAIPGAFGFGHIFIPGDAVRFNNEADLLAWVRCVDPGEYYVEGGSGVLPGIAFRGMISIRWLEAERSTPLPPHTAKAIIFYGINGDIYYNRYWSTGNGLLTGWENLKVNEASLRALIETRAPLNSPVFTGTPTTPTPPDDAVGLEMANAAFVRKLLAALVGSSPEALDTLNELAAALGSDPNFATTVTNALAGKQPLSDVLTAISRLNAQADNLLYFDSDGNASLTRLTPEARSLLAQATPEDMRRVLELERSDTVVPQNNIYDRSEGVVAIPGTLGYGGYYRHEDKVIFRGENGPADFISWVSTTPPGRYAVGDGTSYSAPQIIDKENRLEGIVEIIIPDTASSSSQSRADKLIIFMSKKGEMFINWLKWTSAGAGLAGWGNLSAKGLRSADFWGNPGIDGVTLAAISVADLASHKRGDRISGEKLRHVSLMFENNGNPCAAASVYNVSMMYGLLPGSYFILNGSSQSLNCGNKANAWWICLVMRAE